MKAIVNDKKHITLVSHTNGVTIIEASGCIIDLDYQCLASICEISDINNSYTIAESNRISELEKTIAELEINVSDKAFKISQLEDKLNVASSNSDKDELTERIEFLEKQLTNADNRVTELRNQIIGLTNELDIRAKVISEKDEEIAQLKSDINTASSNADKDAEEYNELCNRNKFLEDKIAIIREFATRLEEVNTNLKDSIREKDKLIQQLTDELNRRDKIIEEKTKRLIELENVEYEINKFRETNNILVERLEDKTSALANKTYWFRYYRRAFRAVKEYLKPNEIYDLDTGGYNIINSIDSKFIISFKDRTVASNALNELRYCVSPRTVLIKHLDDIIEYNTDSMNIYYVENNSNIVYKFRNIGFNIICRDVYVAEVINTLLNCGFPVNDIITSYKPYIVSSNIN